jgi:hypothetical protein
MASNSPFILPQYQGSMYDLQRQQALVNALQKQAMTNPASQLPQGMAVQPKLSPLSILGQIGTQLAANKLGADVGQGMNQLGQQQWNTISSMMGAPQSPQQSAGSADAGAGDAGSADASGNQPVSAGVGAGSNNGASVGTLNPLGMNPTLATMMYMADPGEFMKAQASAYTPTDFQKLLRASGVDPSSSLGQQIIQSQIAKQNYVAPIEGKPGTIARDPFSGQPKFFSPSLPEGSEPLFDASGKVVGVRTIDGVVKAVGDIAKAKAAGEGSVLPYSGVDANGNPLPVTNRTAAATQGVPNAGFPAGTRVPGSGQDTNDTLTLLQNEKKDIMALPDSDPRKNRDLQAINAELSRWQQSLPSPTAVYAAPPMGAQANANAAQEASANTMKASYSRLQSANATSNSIVEALQKMQSLAANKTILSSGVLGTHSTGINPDAAEYEKQRANVIALLSGQQGTNGSDAGRALTGDSVPDYGKPKAAINDGLTTLMNQVKAQQLKANLLTPVYNQGDSKNYTRLENEFDQNISPSLASIIAMPPGKDRAAALSDAAKDPQKRARLEWATNNGVLK